MIKKLLSDIEKNRERIKDDSIIDQVDKLISRAKSLLNDEEALVIKRKNIDEEYKKIREKSRDIALSYQDMLRKRLLKNIKK